MVCQYGLHTVQINVGFHHHGGNGAYGGLAAGQALIFGSWQAAVTRNAAIYTTTYSAALTIGEDQIIGPLALEASAADTADGWERWVSVARFFISNVRFDLGLAYADGGSLNEGKRLLMLRLTTGF